MVASPTADGHPERTAIAGGGACTRAASAADDSAAVDLEAAVSAALGARPPLESRCEIKSGGTYVADRLGQSGSSTLANVDDVVGGVDSTRIV